MKLAAILAPPLAWALSMCSPTGTPTNDHLPCNEWTLAAIHAGWPPEDHDKLLTLMWRESRCQPDAIRRSPRGAPIDVGLMQINQIHRPMLAERGFSHLDMTDPHANLWFARVLYDWWEERGGCGWSPWSATGGKC